MSLSSLPTTLTLYGHRLSQPCRAVEILLRELDLPYQWQEVDFANDETRQVWYGEQVNPFQTVPSLVDSETGLQLGESHAAMRYACRKIQAQSWYPGDQDHVLSGRIDQWLDWHHANIRRYDMFHHIMNLHLTLPMLKREIQATLLAPLASGLRPGLAMLEQQLASCGDHVPMLCGSDQPSIADLSIACELHQIRAVGYQFSPFPKVTHWLDRLAAGSIFQEISAPVDELGRSILEQDGSYLALTNAFA